MAEPGKPAGDPKPFFDIAKASLAAFGLTLALAYLDGMDGETSNRGGVYRLSEDPKEFRGTLILRWGLLATGSLVATIGGIAGGMGVASANGKGRP